MVFGPAVSVPIKSKMTLWILSNHLLYFRNLSPASRCGRFLQNIWLRLQGSNSCTSDGMWFV